MIVPLSVSYCDVTDILFSQDSNLSFNRVRAVAEVAFLGILFDAEFIKFKEQIQLLAKQDDLQKLSECKLNKVLDTFPIILL